MAKLYFRYGTVSSAKTLNLLAVAHNYKQQGKRVLLCKPELDTRFGQDIIQTRAGLKATADVIVPQQGEVEFPNLFGVFCVLVDEVQFLPVPFIDQLRHLAGTDSADIPVICYGLRTDFRRRLFPAAARLLELADSIEEIKTICALCGKHKAVFNLKRSSDGRAMLSGPTVELGCEDKYLPVCNRCYNVAIGEANVGLQ
jgi:thymidine kinase